MSEIAAEEDDEIGRQRHVECRNCEEFEMSKSYRGADETPGKDEFDEIDLPDECPVCGADLVTTMTDGGQPADEVPYATTVLAWWILVTVICTVAGLVVAGVIP